MKSPKNLIISLVLVGFFGWVGFEIYSAIKEDKKLETANRILQFERHDLASMEIQYGNQDQQREIFLKKNSLRWEMTKPIADFVDHDFFYSWRDEMLDQEGRLVADIHSNVDWSKYGLADPAAKIKFGLKDSRSVEILVSAIDTFDKKTYLKVSVKDEEPKLYVGATKWRALLLKLPEEFQEKNLFAWSRKHWDKIKRLNWLRPSQAFSVIRQKGNQWKVEPKTIYPVDSSKVFSFLDDLSKFKVMGFAKSEEQNKALKHKPLLRIEVEFTNTEDPDFKKQTLSFYEQQSSLKEDHSKDILVYNTLGDRWVKISSDSLRVISPDVVDFFDFDFKLNISKVNEVTVSGLGHFVKQDKMWKIGESLKPKNGEKTFDGGKVNLLLTELNNLHAVRFEDEIKPNPKFLLKEFHIEGDGFSKKLVIYNQVGSSQADKDLEDCYLVVEPNRGLPFWVLKSSIEKLLLIEFFK